MADLSTLSPSSALGAKPSSTEAGRSELEQNEATNYVIYKLSQNNAKLIVCFPSRVFINKYTLNMLKYCLYVLSTNAQAIIWHKYYI